MNDDPDEFHHEDPYMLTVNPYSPEVKELIEALMNAGYTDQKAVGVLLSTLAGMTKEMGLDPTMIAVLLKTAHAGIDAQEAAEAEKEADVLRRAQRLN